MFDFKEIHIGSLIRQRVEESEIEINRICNFMKCNEEEISKMYIKESIDTYTLLRWSKLLEYDFFRLYSQHLILYAPPGKQNTEKNKENRSLLPQFKKNIYTREVIDFILERIHKNEKTIQDIITEYGIPKTTLYKWLSKYNQNQ